MAGFLGLFDYTLPFTIPHTHTYTSVHSHVFISRFSVAASKRRTFPFLWIRKCPLPQLPASNSNSSQRLNLSSSITDSLSQSLTNKLNSTQLNATEFTSTQLTFINCPPYNISARTAQKTPFPIIAVSNCCCGNMIVSEAVTR
jgi:hypothetical protein